MAVSMGDIRRFGKDIKDIISLSPVSDIEYPVVTLGAHGTHFYDIRYLIQAIQSRRNNAFPHNRQRIDWDRDVKAVEWDHADHLPADYVARTLGYLEAARALWTVEEQEVVDEVEREQRYILFRTALTKMTTEHTNNDTQALVMERTISRYWLAHPYVEEDRRKGIEPPAHHFMLRHYCDHTHRHAEYFKWYRRLYAVASKEAFFSSAKYGDWHEHRNLFAMYWEVHPLDPLADEADVIALVVALRDRMRTCIEEYRGVYFDLPVSV
jgi:hypothetical protein